MKNTVNGSDMAIVPEAEWELEGIFNSFAFVDEFFISRLEKITEAESKEEGQDTGERLFKKMSRS